MKANKQWIEMNEMASLQTVKALLRLYKGAALKSLGQNFLINEEVLQSIVDAADLTPNDLVLEIGPGPGVLTRELCEKAGKVVAYEIDKLMVLILKKELKYPNFEVRHEDILKARIEFDEYKVIANIPYNLTSRIIRMLLEDVEHRPELIVLMVQKEVAIKMLAENCKESLLSMSIKIFGKVEIIRFVKNKCFYPAPKVDSAVIRITPLDKPLVAPEDIKGVFKFMRAGYGERRKTLVNALANGLGMEKSVVLEALVKMNLNEKIRGEVLTIEEWVELKKLLS